MTQFISKFSEFVYDFVRDNFKFLAVIGYIILGAVIIMANLDKYLLPVAPWEWFVGLHFIPKTVFSLMMLPFVLVAIIHMLAWCDNPSAKKTS